MQPPALATALLGLVLLSGCASLADYHNARARDAAGDPAVGTASPLLSFRADEDLNRLTITTADPDADWHNYAARVNGCSADVPGLEPVVGAGDAPWMNEVSMAGSHGRLAAASTATACGSPLSAELASTATPAVAGDYVDLCVQTTAGARPDPASTMTSVDVEIRDVALDQAVYSYLFADLDRC